MHSINCTYFKKNSMKRGKEIDSILSKYIHYGRDREAELIKRLE